MTWLRPARGDSGGTTFRMASARVAAAAAPEYVLRLARQQLGLCQLTVTNIPMTLKKNSTKKEVHSVTLLHPVVRARAPRGVRSFSGDTRQHTGQRAMTVSRLPCGWYLAARASGGVPHHGGRGE